MGRRVAFVGLDRGAKTLGGGGDCPLGPEHLSHVYLRRGQAAREGLAHEVEGSEAGVGVRHLKREWRQRQRRDRRAGPPELMELETLFLQALDRTQAADVSGGALELRSGDTVLARLTR